MSDDSTFLRPNEMEAADWEQVDKTGLPPRRAESASGSGDPPWSFAKCVSCEAAEEHLKALKTDAKVYDRRTNRDRLDDVGGGDRCNARRPCPVLAQSAIPGSHR
jgi:hypothetical protein